MASIKHCFYSQYIADALGRVGVYADEDGREIRVTEVWDPGRIAGSPHGPPVGDFVGVGVRFLRDEVVDPGRVAARERDCREAAAAMRVMTAAGMTVRQALNAAMRRA